MQDGNITCNVGNVSARDKDRRHRSALSAASYQSGEVLFSNKKQRDVDAREAGDGDVQFTKIIAPTGAPKWVLDRNTLWNNVERDAYRRDNRLAKKIMVAFPREIPDNLRVNLLLDYIKPYVAWGAVADIAIHNDPEDHNPHAHILLTTHKLKPDGFMGKGHKITGLDERRFVNSARQSWAELVNLYLEKVGSSLRVDHRSYKARGIGVEPTRHRGPDFQEKEQEQQHADPTNTREHGRGAAAEQPEQVARQSTKETPERTEDVMTKPTPEELKQYPHLAQQDTWPPAREAAPDMTRQERDEHHRYWQEQDNVEIQHLANDFYGEHQQDFLQAEREPASKLKRQEPEEDEYAYAINKAKQERGWHEPANNEVRAPVHSSLEYGRDMAIEAEYHRDVSQRSEALRKEAVNLHRGVLGMTREESYLLKQARNANPIEERLVKDYIIFKRMEYLQAKENQRLKQEIAKYEHPDRIAAIKERMEAHEQQALENAYSKIRAEREGVHEVDPDRYPVPGPNGELIKPTELEQGLNAMIAEMETEKDIPEPIHDDNEWQRMGRARDEMITEFEKEQERERDR